MANIETIPIILLTGFLGAGKTTLLTRWLEAPEFEGAMVIVNELGEVGLDHRLLTTSTDVPLLLDNGCACCAAQEDLIGTLERLFWDRLHKRIPRFNWVLIETTGVADPLPVIAAIRRHSLLGERYRVAGVVTALDAKRGLERLADFPECENQLKAATTVIITKTDIASGQEVEAVRAELPRLAPHAKVLMSANGELPAGELIATLPTPLPARGQHGDGHGHGHGDHDHDHEQEAALAGVHAGGVTSAFLPLPKPVSWPALISALETLMEAHAKALLRCKGIVRLEGAAGYHGVQATIGQGITRQEVPVDEGEEPPRTGFTIIAAYEPAVGIASSLNAIIAIRSTARDPVAGKGA